MRTFCKDVTFPFVCNVPIALGLGSPSVFLRKALLALAAAFHRKIGCSLSVYLRIKVRLPAASIGAKCFSVVSLHANGREDSLEFKEFLAHLYTEALAGMLIDEFTNKDGHDPEKVVKYLSLVLKSSLPAIFSTAAEAAL